MSPITAVLLMLRARLMNMVAKALLDYTPEAMPKWAGDLCENALAQSGRDLTRLRAYIIERKRNADTRKARR